MVSGFAFVQYFPPLWLSTWTVYLHAAEIKCDRSKRLRPQKVNRSASDIKLLSGLQAVSVCWMHWCIWLFHFGSPAYHLGAPNNTFWFNSSSLIIKVTFKLQSNRVTPWSPACPVPAELALSCRYLLIEMSLLPPLDVGIGCQVQYVEFMGISEDLEAKMWYNIHDCISLVYNHLS